jgi:sRNA-binding carbon storage regulator CsrA
MLVLSRKRGQSIVIDNEVVATVAVVGHEFVDLSLPRAGIAVARRFGVE